MPTQESDPARARATAIDDYDPAVFGAPIELSSDEDLPRFLDWDGFSGSSYYDSDEDQDQDNEEDSTESSDEDDAIPNPPDGGMCPDGSISLVATIEDFYTGINK